MSWCNLIVCTASSMKWASSCSLRARSENYRRFALAEKVARASRPCRPRARCACHIRLNQMYKLFTRKQIIIAIVISVFALGTIVAQSVKQKVRFARGSSSTTINGAVVRGDRDRYYLGAKKGQTMSVKITSLRKERRVSGFSSR